ncbi:MAG: indole-3-glycerol phosphate synthase TrpC [Eggerthellaceae bacterium]|jgi:indole-3-glycerol phosphate synthase|nr:indole-3-glycerol phosphate synthase TrpC [Eggerthellaceae bacterium]
MATILDELAAAARARVAARRAKRPEEELAAAAHALPATGAFPFEAALSGPGVSFICECKKASPSKGLIVPDFPYVDIARAYEDAGAAAVSVLTEPTRFLGSDDYLRDIAAAVDIPCLRKDFTVDAYMIYEAKLLGASAVLLIASLLSADEVARGIELCDELGMSALVEAHDEAEVRTALAADARVVGVNNRNLKDFTVDVGTAERLRALVPADVLFVAESGMRTAADVARMREAGVDAVLVGEALMRAVDKRAALDELRGELR